MRFESFSYFQDISTQKIRSPLVLFPTNQMLLKSLSFHGQQLTQICQKKGYQTPDYLLPETNSALCWQCLCICSEELVVCCPLLWRVSKSVENLNHTDWCQKNRPRKEIEAWSPSANSLYTESPLVVNMLVVPKRRLCKTERCPLSPLYYIKRWPSVLSFGSWCIPKWASLKGQVQLLAELKTQHGCSTSILCFYLG